MASATPGIVLEMGESCKNGKDDTSLTKVGVECLYWRLVSLIAAGLQEDALAN